MSTFLQITAGLIVGLLLCLGGLYLFVKKQQRVAIESAPIVLKNQFSSEDMSSEELALVIERGYRARLWGVVADFFETKPTFGKTIETLGPPDRELRNGALAKLTGEENLGEGAANVLISYKVGKFDLVDGKPSDTFSTIEVYFRGTEFATWSGAGLYPDDPLATSIDSRNNPEEIDVDGAWSDARQPKLDE